MSYSFRSSRDIQQAVANEVDSLAHIQNLHKVLAKPKATEGEANLPAKQQDTASDLGQAEQDPEEQEKAADRLADAENNISDDFGRETTGAEIRKWKWYRLFRESDYEAKAVAEQEGATGEAVEVRNPNANLRTHNVKKSDYFMVITKEYKNYILVIPGDNSELVDKIQSSSNSNDIIDAAQASGSARVVECDSGLYSTNAIATKLATLGITQETPLISIGRHEFARLRDTKKLAGLNLDHLEGFDRKAKYEYRFRSKVFGSFDVASSTLLGKDGLSVENGKIKGALENLTANCLYKLNDTTHFAIIDGHHYDSLPTELVLFEEKDGKRTARKWQYQSKDFLQEFQRSNSEYFLADALHGGKTIHDTDTKTATTIINTTDFSGLENADSTKYLLTTKHDKRNLSEHRQLKIHKHFKELALESGKSLGFHVGKDGAVFMSVTLPDETRWLQLTEKGWQTAAATPEPSTLTTHSINAEAFQKATWEVIRPTYEGKRPLFIGNTDTIPYTRFVDSHEYNERTALSKAIRNHCTENNYKRIPELEEIVTPTKQEKKDPAPEPTTQPKKSWIQRTSGNPQVIEGALGFVTALVSWGGTTNAARVIEAKKAAGEEISTADKIKLYGSRILAVLAGALTLDALTGGHGMKKLGFAKGS